MPKFRNGLIVAAALGLVAAGPASAQTRSAQALPAQAPISQAAPVDRAAQPMTDAAEMGGKISPALIIAFLAILAAILAAAGGGGGGGNDSPG